MAEVAYSARALADLERIAAFGAPDSPERAGVVIERILRALEMLQEHPLLGREVESGLRELVISRAKTGYVALYRFDEARDGILVLAVRHQREAGWA